ncbi:MAG TPA: efflux RND transporter permease subunit, partial [Candidatus Binataceae bacterium]|nr:efflux RND transporter permease subunit [Candidatus Binataceae bacterium]
IDVTFSEGVDPTTSYQLLNAALGEVRGRLPSGTTIDTRLLTTGTFPILDLSLSSKVRSLPELTDIGFYDIVPSLHRIAGVYRVEMVGAKYREYVVRIDPAKLLAHELGPDDVVSGLAKANIIESAGRVSDAHRMLLTVVSADISQPEQVAAIPIADVNGQPVLVRDIGSVEVGVVEDYIRTASEKGPALLIGVSRQPRGNTVQIADEIGRLIASLQARYPDVNFSLSYNQAALVTESFKSVRDAIVLGLALAVLVVLFFTGSIVNAIIAAIVVPCTLAITFVVMKQFGLSFNMMTLGGLAAGIGLFIDDAIVMIEGVHRARGLGVATEQGVADALRELTKPLVASTMTVVLVFAPLVLLSGVTGTFFRALAITLGAGLFISLLLALFFIPALEVMLEPMRRASGPAGRIFNALRDAYLAAVRPFTRVPALAVVLAIASLGATWVLYHSLGTDYLPSLDEGAFILDYTTPPQSTLPDTLAMLSNIESILKTTPEVAAFSVRTGTQLGFFLTESNRGDMSVRLKADRSRSIDAIMDDVRGKILGSVPGVRVEFAQVIQDLIGDLSGTPEPIEVKVFGADQGAIEETAQRVAAELGKIPGVVDVFDGIVLSNPEEAVEVDEIAAQRYGISAADVQATLHSVIEGTVATQVRVNDRLYGVRVRYPDNFHHDLSSLSEVLLKTPNNGRVPLPLVTRLKYLGRRAELDHERLRPVLHVTARLGGNLDLGTAMAQVQSRMRGLILPAGVTLDYGGLYAEQQNAFSQLAMVLVAGALVIFLILVWEFGRLAPALACLLAAMASLAGSFGALAITGITLNISSFMGIIMVAGITAKNGILLLDHAERRIAEGLAPASALIEAAQIRLRPIMMTTLATAAGLLPLAMGIGAGAKVQQPLALAVIWGLSFAMLFATPLAGGLYLLGNRARTEQPPAMTN